jgi:hypothetical protein
MIRGSAPALLYVGWECRSLVHYLRMVKDPGVQANAGERQLLSFGLAIVLPNKSQPQ